MPYFTYVNNSVHMLKYTLGEYYMKDVKLKEYNEDDGYGYGFDREGYPWCLF